MLNIICVKIGEKYDSSDVNRLLYICKKYCSIPFNFFCYTDNPLNLNSDIKVIDFVDNQISIIVHNKLFLFSDYIEDQIGEGPRLFFDIDIVFRSSIDKIARVCNEKLTVIKAVWRIPVHKNFPKLEHDLNSSCMSWIRSDQTKAIWEHYNSNKQQFCETYKNGMDPYLYYEFIEKGITINTFPLGLFRSHLFGLDVRLNDKRENSVNGVYRESKVAHLATSFPVIIMNGPTTAKQFKYYDNLYSDSISATISAHKPS